jgi:carbamoyltransferase
MNVLGISGLAHNPAAALVGERGVLAAIEEGKLLRTRSVAGIPREAIRFCLASSGIGWSDVAMVALAGQRVQSGIRASRFRVRQTPFAPVPHGYYQTKAHDERGRELNNDRIIQLLGAAPGTRVLRFDHHLCHAASAFYASSADRALILTFDEQGDGRAGMVALGEGTRIRALRRFAFPHSLGWVYSQVTDLIGFGIHNGEHKTQWLSLVGEPVHLDLFLRMFRRSPSGPLHLDMSYFNRGMPGRIAFSARFYSSIGLDPKRARGGGESDNPLLPEKLRRDLAASVQQACARVIAELAESYRKKTAATSLCLAGGVFLNPLLVFEVEKSTGFEHVFAQPAAGNEGTSLGAAWLAWHEKLRKPRVEPPSHLYWGPAFSNQEIKQVLDNCKARYRWDNGEDQQIQETIRLLEAGKIVGWYRGAAEFGPRALGNRSLLGSPWAPYVKENLNEFVKHREAFRPFALAVPAEDAPRYFEYSSSARFMASLGRVLPDAHTLLEAFLLPGDLVRVHVVEREVNPALWQLLRRFGERAPAPILVNTSFNLFSESLVISPRDAVRSYFCSGMDALVIGSFTLTKA